MPPGHAARPPEVRQGQRVQPRAIRGGFQEDGHQRRRKYPKGGARRVCPELRPQSRCRNQLIAAIKFVLS